MQGFDSGRRAAVHADLFGVPKTQAIYLDLEDVNGDKPATYTAARPARDGFAAEASIVLPPMTRAADCLPAALVFIESFDASLAMHGYRGALYSGREFLRNTPSQNLPTLISQAFGVPSLFNLANGLARALVPAGLWVANGTTITTTPTRSYGGNRTYYDQATTLSGFPNPFTVGNTPLAPYRSFSGSQFSFNPPGKVVGLVRRAPKPMLSRGPVSKVTNADCFFPSESNADAQAPVVGALLGDLPSEMVTGPPKLRSWQCMTTRSFKQ